MSTRRRGRYPIARPGISRRDFIKYSGAGIAGASLLTACGGFTGGEEGGGGGLIFTHGPDDSGSIQALLDEWNGMDKITVTWREMPADTGAYFDKLRTEFQAGGGDIDIISGDVIWPAQFATNEWIVDLSDRLSSDLEDQIVDGAMQANIVDGKVYGVPWFTDGGLLYYRKDLLDEEGVSQPPVTWDELKEMALQVSKATKTKYGMVFQGANYEGGVVDGLEFIWNHGGDVLDPEDPSTVIIDSPEAAAGLETERSLVEEGIAPEAVANFLETESHTAFLNGDSVFLRNWPYVYGLAADPKQSKIKPEQIGIAALPVAEEGMQSSSGLGGWNLFINSQSDVQDDGWELIQFLASEESQKKKTLKGSFLPTIESLYDDQEITSKVPVIPLAKDVVLPNARPRPVSPFYSDMSLAMAEQFNANLKGEGTPEEIVASLQEELQSIIQEGTS
jgi:multiple sugar transport system substrate-binding protein